MTRPDYIQVQLPENIRDVLDDLASKEHRSLSAMGAVLVQEALTARGYSLPMPSPHESKRRKKVRRH